MHDDDDDDGNDICRFKFKYFILQRETSAAFPPEKRKQKQMNRNRFIWCVCAYSREPVKASGVYWMLEIVNIPHALKHYGDFWFLSIVVLLLLLFTQFGNEIDS